jgi:hypothetical protein
LKKRKSKYLFPLSSILPNAGLISGTPKLHFVFWATLPRGAPLTPAWANRSRAFKALAGCRFQNHGPGCSIAIKLHWHIPVLGRLKAPIRMFIFATLFHHGGGNKKHPHFVFAEPALRAYLSKAS